MSNDFLDELGELALGSRLKRLSERMLADAAAIYQHFNMDIQPKWFTLLALIDKKHSVSVVEASEYLGLSQPALSQFCRQLLAEELIQVDVEKNDSRKKYMSLSDKGKARVTQMKPVWQAVEGAAKDLCEEQDNQFYQSLITFEQALAKRSLLLRSIEQFTAQHVDESIKQQISIVDFSPEFAPYFDSINSQWIEKMFVLEEVDKQVLRYPQHNIIDKGGRIWFAIHPTMGVVGTCALLKKQEGCFELTKMGVLENARGLKVGEILLQHVIQQAVLMKPECLFLLTNADCEAAIHLYEKNGFEHDKDIMNQYGKSYERCNVAMRYKL